jgi:thioredoxin-like negative regulator of GroEL
VRSRSIRKALFAGCVCVAVAGIGGFILREPIRARVNGIRAERLMEKAETAFAAEDWGDAARLGRAAHFLDSDNRQTDLLVARALLKEHNPSSIGWWKRVLDEPDLPIDELRILTHAVLQQGDLDNGLLFLNRLMQLDPDNPGTQRLWLTALGMQGRLGSAQAYAEQMNLEFEVVPGEQDDSDALASNLFRAGEWKLLQQVLARRLLEDPDNPALLVKLLAAHYHSGDAAALPDLLARIKPGALESQPVWESFVHYLNLLNGGFEPDLHLRMEQLLARYPEVFEYRLVLALSFLLQGQAQLARGLIVDMPDLPPATARHLRVCAVILGMPEADLILPGEKDLLLPRERALIQAALE